MTLARLHGCSLDAIRALTKHKSAGVIGIYARHGFEAEKRIVAEAIADEVTALLDGHPCSLLRTASISVLN